jgi:AraC-like DNA-binding protein
MELMSGVVLSSATGAYHDRPPAASLRDHFSSTWFNTLPVSGAVAVVPDGFMDLQWIDGELRIAGPDREVMCERLRPGAVVIGFRFRPGAASRWLGTPASEIVGARVRLDAFWGREARSIADWVGTAASTAEIVRRLEIALARRAPGIAAPDPVAAVVRRLVDDAARGSPKDVVRHLCSELGMSERTLRRRCHEAFGYGPKTLQRVLRFQQFLRCVGEGNAGGGGIAGLASELGYSDQAHLTREARRLASMTPAGIRHQFPAAPGRFVQDAGEQGSHPTAQNRR